MWCISLLINTSTWDEFLQNWQLICLVFMELHLGQDNVKREHYDALLDRIRKIRSDATIKKAINATGNLPDDDDGGKDISSSSVYDYRNDDADTNLQLPRSNSSSSKRRKVRKIEKKYKYF